MARTWVTTSDNPFDYFKQYDLWESYDEKACGYDTNAYVARLIHDSPDMSPGERDRETEEACDRVVAMDLRYISPVTGKEVCYVKITDPD